MCEIKQELSFTEEYLKIYAIQWASSSYVPYTIIILRTSLKLWISENWKKYDFGFR